MATISMVSYFPPHSMAGLRRLHNCMERDLEQPEEYLGDRPRLLDPIGP